MRLTYLLAMTWIVGSGTTLANAQTLAFDWGVRNNQVAGSDVLPVPHQGHDYPANHVFYQTLYNTLDAQGLPVSLMLQNDQGGNGTLMSVLDNVSVGYMDYVFADFESANRESHVNTMVSQVRNHSNSNVADAFIGNYAMYPGAYDASQHFAHIADRTIDFHSDAHNFYLDSGLNVAMPNAYPYEYFEAHSVNLGGIVGWGTFLSPNKRSGLFYGPLERVSVARRSLNEEAGHENDLLIPWLAGAVEWNGYNAPDPTVEDHKALAQHIRLRGADGYYTLVSWIGADGSTTPPAGYPSHEQYRENVFDAWTELDWIFAGAQPPEILNLDTVKITGVEWSGVRQGDQVLFLVTNLGDSAAQVDYPDLPGLPDFSPVVPIGTHQTFTYTLTPSTPGDFDSDGDVDGADLLVWQQGFGTTYDATDLADWETNYPTPAPAVGAAVGVPEPTSLALFVIGVLGSKWISRRSR